jgi:hypothetical protein
MLDLSAPKAPFDIVLPYVIGMDMEAALRLVVACRYDLAVLSELLPAAEAGLIEASSLTKKQP